VDSQPACREKHVKGGTGKASVLYMRSGTLRVAPGAVRHAHRLPCSFMDNAYCNDGWAGKRLRACSMVQVQETVAKSTAESTSRSLWACRAHCCIYDIGPTTGGHRLYT